MTTRRERRATRATVVGALAALLSSTAGGGCSFVKMRPSPPPSEWPNPVTASSSEYPCTSSLGPPIVDTVIAGALGALTYVERDSGSRAITIIFGVGSLPYLASAIYGYVNNARCRSYQSMFHPE